MTTFPRAVLLLSLLGPLQKLQHALSHLIGRHDLLIVLNINYCRLELPSRHSAVEQDITLAIRAVLELRKEEEGHDPADDCSTSPDVTTLACEIPSGRIE